MLIVVQKSRTDLVTLEEICMRESEGETLLADRDGLEHTAVGQLLVHHLTFVLQRSPGNKITTNNKRNDCQQRSINTDQAIVSWC